MWIFITQHWEAIFGLIGLVTGVFSLFLSCSSNRNSKKANQKSDEANELSKKSLAISYDATFNDFLLQLRGNYSKILSLKHNLEKIPSQNKGFFSTISLAFIVELGQISGQKQYARPSEYSTHYEELENLAQDVISKYDIMGKIIESSDEENPMKSDRFKKQYEEALKIFDAMLNKIETKIKNTL